MPSPNYLTIEKLLAISHQSLARAADRASTMGDLSLYDDITDIMIEVGRVQESMLKARYRRARPNTTVRN